MNDIQKKILDAMVKGISDKVKYSVSETLDGCVSLSNYKKGQLQSILIEESGDIILITPPNISERVRISKKTDFEKEIKIPDRILYHLL